MEADAALRGLRFKVGRLVAQQQTRHGSHSRSLPGPPPALRMREATAPPPSSGGEARRALRLPPRFAALGRGGWGVSVVSLTGSGDGDVRERAGGGQEEPERGAGRECEAVSATGGGGWPRPSSGEGVPPGRAGPGLVAARPVPLLPAFKGSCL